MSNVVIIAAARTPIGTIGGQFKTLTATDLSIPVMQALVERSGMNPELIDDVIYTSEANLMNLLYNNIS